VRWVFPRLLDARLPRYDAIVREHGYAVSAADVAGVRDEADFLALVEGAVSGGQRHKGK